VALTEFVNIVINCFSLGSVPGFVPSSVSGSVTADFVARSRHRGQLYDSTEQNVILKRLQRENSPLFGLALLGTSLTPLFEEQFLLPQSLVFRLSKLDNVTLGTPNDLAVGSSALFRKHMSPISSRPTYDRLIAD
jgi:hypothetical protein